MTKITARPPSVLVFDTETTGVPINKWKNWDQCHMIQISWIIIIGTSIKTVRKFFIKNDYRFNSTKASLQVHNISDEEREEKGVYFNEAFTQFCKDITDKDLDIVCHGTDFDIALLVRECKRWDEDNDSAQMITMFEGLLAKSDGRNRVVYDTKMSDKRKNPKIRLKDLVMKVSPGWKCSMSDIKEHDSLYDSFLCAELFRVSDKNSMRLFMRALYDRYTS